MLINSLEKKTLTTSRCVHTTYYKTNQQKELIFN